VSRPGRDSTRGPSAAVDRLAIMEQVQSPEALALIGAAVAVGVALAVVFVWRRRRRRAAVAAAAPPVGAVDTGATPGWGRIRERLGAGDGLVARLRAAWGTDKDIEARFADLEEVLLAADVGTKATAAVLAKLRLRARELTTADALRAALRSELVGVLETGTPVPSDTVPLVILVAGVNGVGKTTTIAKLAHRYRVAGKKVLLVAADTFRAAAAEQLAHWAERVGADCVRHQAGSDPAAVAHDGLAAALARGADVVIVDTAGRLHVKKQLIEELKKIVRIIGRQVEGAPHEVLLVLDATTGQNAIVQARVFEEALKLTGIVLTKLDGTAKGGAVVATRSELGIPIRFVGLGEKVEDLAPFDAVEFVDALLVPAATPAENSA